MTNKSQLLGSVRVLCVLLGLQLSLVACANFPCTFTGSQGTYDLSQISGQITARDSGNQWTFFIQMCGTALGSGSFTSACTGLNPKSMVCQVATNTPSLAYAIAYPDDTTGTHVYQEIENGINLVAYGSSCSNKPRTANFLITCDPTITGPIPTSSVIVTEVSATCTYNIPFSHAAGCPSSSGGGGGGSGGSSSSSISGGSVFLIVFFVGAFVYVAAGCFYKRYQKGTTGMIESCPNNEFWTAIPGLVKDGCLYTVRKVRSLCSGGGGSTSGATGTYESI